MTRFYICVVVVGYRGQVPLCLPHQPVYPACPAVTCHRYCVFLSSRVLSCQLDWLYSACISCDLVYDCTLAVFTTGSTVLLTRSVGLARRRLSSHRAVLLSLSWDVGSSLEAVCVCPTCLQGETANGLVSVVLGIELGELFARMGCMHGV